MRYLSNVLYCCGIHLSSVGSSAHSWAIVLSDPKPGVWVDRSIDYRHAVYMA